MVATPSAPSMELPIRIAWSAIKNNNIARGNIPAEAKNFHEALIYSIQSNLWGMNCVSLLKDLLTDKSKYLFKNDETKFYKLAQVYFDVSRFYSLTLKNTGDIFQSLDQFD